MYKKLLEKKKKKKTRMNVTEISLVDFYCFAYGLIF